MATSFPPTAMQGPTFLGHPRGLFVLFFTELWERFSYYGMRALLIFYLTKHFLFGDEPAYGIYGAYTSLVYVTPVIGGYLADKYLGARRAVLVGGLFIAVGHLMIGLLEGPVGTQGGYLNGFYLGLASIIVGTGFLKANISVLVGQLYPRGDARRDPGFSIFYMGINIGGASGPIICGLLGETVGWSWGFGAAGVGMLLGLVVFVLFRKDLMGVGEPPEPVLLRARTAVGVSREWAIYLGAFAAVAVAWWLLQSQGVVGTLLVVFAASTIGFILYRAVFTLPKVERDRVFGALFLIALCPLFWALFEQAGSSLNVYTDRAVDRSMFGYEIPASLFQSVNSIFIVLMAPVFAALWTFLDRRRLEPSAPFKFGIGLIVIGLGFLVLVFGAALTPGAPTPAMFILLLYFFHTAAELCFSPVGLAAMTRLSVSSMVGLMMGTWFLATAAGNFLAGQIAQATGGENVGPERVLEVYSRIGWVSIVIGVVVLLIAPFVVRLMHLELMKAGDPVLAGQDTLAEPAAAGTRTEGEHKA
ncbi:peptide MFS transporter [Sphingomonas prati]|uniref:POT family proton-dependent oligopeptide transporter n=1 Tax=Sphingomonas prati TaxID=1843237 RepID=A0A7W9BTX4_9SPHN|nr:peptide MFS transporter [Sphingomonas prati]MBB5729563.1 POT family proton-dependent oligopeptide transporter [Sphingomonas prati]GGE76509.1 dihydroorotate dehydrogenase [Sphingomonas prati]